jgi:hypothetical protein
VITKRRRAIAALATTPFIVLATAVASVWLPFASGAVGMHEGVDVSDAVGV